MEIHRQHFLLQDQYVPVHVVGSYYIEPTIESLHLNFQYHLFAKKLYQAAGGVKPVIDLLKVTDPSYMLLLCLFAYYNILLSSTCISGTVLV
jgi:hypothetical protein